MKWEAYWALTALVVLAIVGCGSSGSPRPPSFDPMQPDPNNLTVVLGPMIGTGSRTFTVTASRSMSLTIGCIGKGTLMVLGPRRAGAALCGVPDAAGTFGTYYWSNVSWVRPGERIKLRVVADAKTIWDIRVDGLPRDCVDDVCGPGVTQTGLPA